VAPERRSFAGGRGTSRRRRGNGRAGSVAREKGGAAPVRGKSAGRRCKARPRNGEVSRGGFPPYCGGGKRLYASVLGGNTGFRPRPTLPAGAGNFRPDKSRGNARTRRARVSNDFGGAGLFSVFREGFDGGSGTAAKNEPGGRALLSTAIEGGGRGLRRLKVLGRVGQGKCVAVLPALIKICLPGFFLSIWPGGELLFSGRALAGEGGCRKGGLYCLIKIWW
jgi:hypothetical protein